MGCDRMTKFPLVKIPCPCCGGRGVRALEKHLRETLGVLMLYGDMTASTLHRYTEDAIGVTGVNNRLEDLRALGLVTRRRNGKSWVYSACVVGQGAPEAEEEAE